MRVRRVRSKKLLRVLNVLSTTTRCSGREILSGASKTNKQAQYEKMRCSKDSPMEREVDCYKGTRACVDAGVPSGASIGMGVAGVST